MRYLLLLALFLTSLGASAQNELILGIHTDEPAPSIGALIANAKSDDYTLRIQPFASVDRLREELAAGRIDLALIEETRGEEAGVAVIADIYPGVLHILYNGETTPANLGDLLRLGPIWAGASGSIGHTVARALAGDFGVAAHELNLLEDAWTVEPQVYFIFGGILANDALSRLSDFRLYSLDDPASLMHGSVAEGIALRYPNLRPFILPAQLYPALGDRPALTLSVSTLLVAHEALDEQLAFEISAIVQAILPRIAAIYPLADLPQFSSGAQQARALPLHPGVQRYRDRDLPGFFERNSEFLGFSATLVLTTVSAFIAWRRHRKQSRKDKLDTYYQKLLTYRSALNELDTNRQSIAAQTRDTQAEVMGLVIDERIDANGALLAFLSLSNQILAEANVATTA